MAESCRRVMEIEIPMEVVRQRVQAITMQLQRRARLPGFRPGKAPVSIVREKFRDDIRAQVLRELVPEYVWASARENQWEPVGNPTVTDVQYEEGSPLRFKATVEVLPNIELQDYRSLSVEMAEPEVSEQEVQQALEQLQEQAATYINLEPRPVQDGDYASIAVEVISPGQESPGVQMEEVLCEVGGSNTLSEFTENLRGVEVGEDRSFDVHYPSDSRDPRLAGKTISYRVKVLGLKERHLPELNDEFARELGEFDSLEAVRQQLRGNLLKSKLEEMEQTARNHLRRQLVQLHDFPVPETLVERQIERKLERLKRQIAAQGMKPQGMALDWGKIRASQREGAMEDVKSSLILEKIAQEEKLEVGEAEIEQEVQKIAVVTQQTPALVRARLTKEGGLDKINSRLRIEKALEFILRQARKKG
ncbi:MAG: trigger factor [Acidobacteria bacterium]|nr:trigger factor [Acidobacteriota bacterium]